MVITYHGADFFKIQFGDTVIAVNPIAKDSSVKGARFGADIALISTNDPEHNGADAVSRSDKMPFVISGPGEYEVSGIFIKGFLSKTSEGRINTVYTVSLENMNLCFLGSFGESALPAAAKEGIDVVDIAFVPTDAEKIATQLEPKLIIPANYDATTLKTFLKEAGAEDVKPTDKLTIKKKDIESMEGEVVVLSVV